MCLCEPYVVNGVPKHKRNQEQVIFVSKPVSELKKGRTLRQSDRGAARKTNWLACFSVSIVVLSSHKSMGESPTRAGSTKEIWMTEGYRRPKDRRRGNKRTRKNKQRKDYSHRTPYKRITKHNLPPVWGEEAP